MIHTVTIDLTTHCNRRCLDCCAGIGINRKLEHHPWSYFEQAAKVFYGIEWLNLTGGEPTSHPDFDPFVGRFRKLFGCRKLSMSTNGYRVREHIDLITSELDSVDFSDYGDNREALLLLRQRDIPVRVYDAGLLGINFTPRTKRGTGSCFRACAESGTVAYADGKLHGCCVAPGISSAIAIEPAANWRETIEQAPLPCSQCWFATG